MRFKRWLVVLLVCIGLIAVLGTIKVIQIKQAIAFGESFPEPSETVEFERAEFSLWQPSISVVGEVRASRELELRNEVDGIIAKIGFTAGGAVKQGDVLIQLDIAEEQAQLDALQPQLELARKNVKRLSGLVSKRAISEQQSDQVNSQLAVLEAQFASTKEAIANKTLIAPFDGVAGLHDLEVGEFLPANTVITFIVGGLDTLWVDFSLPQQYAQLAISTPVLVELDALPPQAFTAQVIAVEPSISNQSRALKARAALDNKSRLIKPGAMVRITAPVSNQQQVIRLSNTAVRIDAFGSYVYRLNKDDKQQWRASRQAVEIAAKEGAYSIVMSGVEEGQVVAALGSFKLREGLLVYQSKKQAHSDGEDVKVDAPSTSINSVQNTALENTEITTPEFEEPSAESMKEPSAQPIKQSTKESPSIDDGVVDGQAGDQFNIDSRSISEE